MSSLSVSPDAETPRIDRKYWNLRRILPIVKHLAYRNIDPMFELQREKWTLLFSLCDDELSVAIRCESNEAAYQFYNVWIGIFGESGKAITVTRVKAIGPRSFNVENFIPRSRLYSILQSEELLIFFMEVEKKSQEKVERIQKSKLLKNKSQTDFRDLLLSGERSDFTIIVKSKTFTCHTLILGARSPVFSAMMNHEMKEKCSGEMIVTDAEPSVFEEFLQYIYTGSEEYLNWENVTELYKLSHKYEVRDLQQLCTRRIKAAITVENFHEWLLFSHQYNDSELSDFITDIIFLENSEDIIKSETWIEFHNKYPSETDVLMKAMDMQRIAWEQRMAPSIVFAEDDYDRQLRLYRESEERERSDNQMSFATAEYN